MAALLHLKCPPRAFGKPSRAAMKTSKIFRRSTSSRIWMRVSRVADGSVLMYNFDSATIHSNAPGGFNLAVVYANDDGLDKNIAMLAAHAKENPAAGDAFGSMMELGAHRDSLGRVLAFQHK
jgi:hypothetical protein